MKLFAVAILFLQFHYFVQLLCFFFNKYFHVFLYSIRSSEIANCLHKYMNFLLMEGGEEGVAFGVDEPVEELMLS